MYTKKHKNFLLSLARKTIAHYLETRQKPETNEVVDSKLKEARGVFVTLTIDGELRGCIGHLTPVQPLYLDVIDNSVNAAFHDPRFPGLSENELNKISIEISVLSVPDKLPYSDAEDLLKKLKPNEHGIIIRKGMSSATFLPQVWEELPKKEDFLSRLCVKGGSQSDCWMENDVEVYTYQAQEFS